MRRKVVAGNWKMNKTPKEAAKLARALKTMIAGAGCDVVLCVPGIDIPAVGEALRGTDIRIGAQNMHFEDSGAFTGEISPKMLLDAGVSHVIIGHSERRAYFGETDGVVNKKVKKALESGLIPIVCVGESLGEREDGISMERIRMQVKLALKGVASSDAEKIILAYEPIWAIGTGKTASNEQAEEVCFGIRTLLKELFGPDTAEIIRIQYGGSVNKKNAAGLFAMGSIDGGLVGGASLTEEFAEIVKAAGEA